MDSRRGFFRWLAGAAGAAAIAPRVVIAEPPARLVPHVAVPVVPSLRVVPVTPLRLDMSAGFTCCIGIVPGDREALAARIAECTRPKRLPE